MSSDARPVHAVTGPLEPGDVVELIEPNPTGRPMTDDIRRAVYVLSRATLRGDVTRWGTRKGGTDVWNDDPEFVTETDGATTVYGNARAVLRKFDR